MQDEVIVVSIAYLFAALVFYIFAYIADRILGVGVTIIICLELAIGVLFLQSRS